MNRERCCQLLDVLIGQRGHRKDGGKHIRVALPYHSGAHCRRALCRLHEVLTGNEIELSSAIFTRAKAEFRWCGIGVIEFNVKLDSTWTAFSREWTEAIGLADMRDNAHNPIRDERITHRGGTVSTALFNHAAREATLPFVERELIITHCYPQPSGLVAQSTDACNWAMREEEIRHALQLPDGVLSMEEQAHLFHCLNITTGWEPYGHRVSTVLDKVKRYEADLAAVETASAATSLLAAGVPESR